MLYIEIVIGRDITEESENILKGHVRKKNTRCSEKSHRLSLSSCNPEFLEKHGKKLFSFSEISLCVCVYVDWFCFVLELKEAKDH